MFTLADAVLSYADVRACAGKGKKALRGLCSWHLSRFILSSFSSYRKDAGPLQPAMRALTLLVCSHFKESGISLCFHSVPPSPR